jgi:glycosyltransferase involved in cell wall biosynthesis
MMIRLFINGLAASAGGGLTYLRNVIPELAKRDVATSVLLNPELRREFEEDQKVSFVEATAPVNSVRRFWFEQTELPGLLRNAGAQVLISAGNFALLKSPVPQILLSRNSLYTSSDFLRDLLARRDYAIWADTKVKAVLAGQSIRRADLTIAPSEAFARDLSAWAGKEVLALHHGFNAEVFNSDATPLPAEVQAQLAEGADALRLLFVSHYNYYRNFETLFRAIPIVRKFLPSKKIKLYLTCRLNSRANPGAYKAEQASSLAATLRGDREIVELGMTPYGSLHHLYRACHIYVTPAYAESFAHPLVEAMSSGLPVVASDLPVHREICGSAALYFDRFSAEELAKRVVELSTDEELATKLSRSGVARARDFSWETHVTRLVELAMQLAGGHGTRHAAPAAASRAARE